MNQTFTDDPVPGLPLAAPEPVAPGRQSPMQRAWQGHVDAGRIGRRPAPDPLAVANREAMDRLFRKPVGRW